MLILRNCSLINDLTENYPHPTGDLLLHNNHIQDIQQPGYNFGLNAPEIDLKFKTVLPGFFDCHIHLTLSGDDVVLDNLKSIPELTIYAQKYAQDTLMAGFTTIRDVGSSYECAIHLRNLINQGVITGPRIIPCGRILTPTENGNDFFAELYVEVDDPYAIRKAVREEIKRGADFIKIMASGAIMNPGGDPGQLIYTEDEIHEIVSAAAFKNSYVAAHCHGTDAIKASIRAGVRTIEHASMLDDECIEMLKEAKSYIIPTISTLKGLEEGLPKSSEFMYTKEKQKKAAMQKGIGMAYQAGLTMGFGTDQGVTNLFHGENAEEFVQRKNLLDMKEIDILKQATIYSAQILGLDNCVGSIKIGKLADLVIVDGNPLSDISLVKTNVVMVIKDGVIVNNKL